MSPNSSRIVKLSLLLLIFDRLNKKKEKKIKEKLALDNLDEKTYNYKIGIDTDFLKKYDEVAIINDCGDIIFSKKGEDILDIFSVFPHAKKVIVVSDYIEKFIKLDNGFVYVKSKEDTDLTNVLKFAENYLKDLSCNRR